MAESAARIMEPTPGQAPTSAPNPRQPREVPRIGDRGRAEAAALVWKWQDQGDAAQADRAGALRKKGVFQGAIGLAVAAVFFVIGWRTMSMVVTAIASLTLLTALISPTGAYAAIERGLTRFAAIVGSVVAWIVLMPSFIGFFVPFGLIFRRGEKDPMKRMFSPSAPSYWRERVADEDVEGRRKSQF